MGWTPWCAKVAAVRRGQKWFPSDPTKIQADLLIKFNQWIVDWCQSIFWWIWWSWQQFSIFQAGNQGLRCPGTPPCGVGMSRYLTASKEQQQEASWTGHVMRDKNDRSCYRHVPISRLLVASSSSEFVQGPSQSFLHPSRACHRLDARLRKALWMCFPILSPMPWQIKVRLAREPGNNGHAVHGKTDAKRAQIGERRSSWKREDKHFGAFLRIPLCLIQSVWERWKMFPEDSSVWQRWSVKFWCTGRPCTQMCKRTVPPNTRWLLDIWTVHLTSN